MVLSGIRPSFPGLSRSARQITHVLLTRSPLEYPQQAAGLSVRLACVKHAASVRPEPGSNSPQKNFRTNPKQAVKSPKPNKRTNHHKPQKPVLASKKLLQRKNKQFPQPDGVKNKETKKVEHNHMPTNPSQCSRNTKQHSKRYVFHIPNRHTPTNKPLSLLADKPINTQPCTQKIKSTLAHY